MSTDHQSLLRYTCERIRIVGLSCVFLCVVACALVKAQTVKPAGPLPPLRRLPTAQAVVQEHLEALNHCDWNRVMAQYPNDVEIFLPGGEVIKGRNAVGVLFRDIVKPFKEGGLCGVTFRPEQTMLVGNTLSVQWRATANFLTRAYLGADAYITKDGLMAAQVTTFDRSQLK